MAAPSPSTAASWLCVAKLCRKLWRRDILNSKRPYSGVLTKLLLGLKRYKEAIAAYEQALRLAPQHAAYSQAKGLALYALQQYEEALLAYDTAIQHGSPDPYCYYEKGQALFGLERYEDTILAFQQALDHSSPHPDPQFYHMQAQVYERLAQRMYDKEQQARKHWVPTRTSDPFEIAPRYQLFTLLKSLTGHTNSVYSMAFSSDGHLLASGSFDQTIKLWNVQTRQLLHTLQGHTSNVYGVAFSPDGRLLASGSGDKTIKLWGEDTHGI